MSVALSSISKDPVSQPGQADEEVVKHVNILAGVNPNLIVMVHGMVSALNIGSLC